LASIENFEPYVAFQRIDRNRNDMINAQEIQDYLRENNIFGVTLDEAEYIVRFFDSDEDMKLCYSEYFLSSNLTPPSYSFLQMLVPCDN
jgi:Ca2+-binding EF-hand superfamily protein